MEFDKCWSEHVILQIALNLGHIRPMAARARVSVCVGGWVDVGSFLIICFD
jgi:hypothetical protein